MPFDMCLADGRRVPVQHPEFVAMNKRIVIVIDEESLSSSIERLLIVSLEPAQARRKPDNVPAKKRRPPS